MSGGLLLIQLYDLNSEAWNIASREISPSDFKEIATALVTFLMLAHLISWLSDYLAYTKWFQSNKVQGDSIGAIGSFKRNTEAMVSGLINRISRLNKDLAVLEEISRKKTQDGDFEQASNVTQKVSDLQGSINELSEKIAGLERDLAEVSSRLDDIAPGFRTVSWMSRIVVFGWYLAVPTLVFIAAIYHLWCPEA